MSKMYLFITVLLFSLLFFLTACIKIDLFPITNVIGDIEQSYIAVADWCQHLSYHSAVKKLSQIQFKYELGNEIVLPNIFLQRGYGDCDEFAVMNGFIAKYFGYEAYIVYARINKVKLHYTTIVKTMDGYVIAEWYDVSQAYPTLQDTKKFFEQLSYQIEYLKIIPFEEFLQILLK